MFDPTTGIKVIQLTSYPLPSAHFPYYWPSITPDNKRILIYSQRFLQRDAPWDIFRVDADGLNLFQLSERGDRHEDPGYYGRQYAVLSHDGKTLYTLWDKDVYAIDVENGDETHIANVSSLCNAEETLSYSVLSFEGRYIYFRKSSSFTVSIRLDLRTGEAVDVELGGLAMGCMQTEPRVMVQAGEIIWGSEPTPDGGRRITNIGSKPMLYSVDEDGGDPRLISPNIYAHCTLLGKTSAVQGCGLPPERCIWIAEEGSEPRKLCSGPYFWHSGASYDGEWIVADTNWPDSGLQLIHVPTGHFRTLCHTGASLDHYEFGHTHPLISNDGRLVVFRSDRTGCPQVYVAHVNEEFRQSIIAGELDRPKDKWI
jgi:Tol biopolymer transport system component